MSTKNIDEILNTIFKNLDTELKSNKSLIELKNTCINLIKIYKQGFYISLNENIYNKVEYFHKFSEIIPVADCEEEIFSISSHDKKNLIFSLSKRKDFYYSTLVTSKRIIENEESDTDEETKEDEEILNEAIEISIVISEYTTTWSTTKVIVDEDNYYYDYEFELYSFNKNNEMIEIENLEEQKDQQFSDFFGVPKEKSRNYRKNFYEFIEEINTSKIKKEEKLIDEYYSNESKLFAPPFLMTEMASYLIDGIPTDEELDEEEREDLDEELIEKTSQYIENKIIKRTGALGVYTMTYNLYLNLTAFIANPNIPLFTSGIIIRKIKNTYTSFYISFEKTEIIIIEKSLTKEEVKKLYDSNDNNKNIYGIEEFFSETNTYGLK